MDLLGILICKWKGHLRGKKIAQTQNFKEYRCPRCGGTWSRKVNGKAKP